MDFKQSGQNTLIPFCKFFTFCGSRSVLQFGQRNSVIGVAGVVGIFGAIIISSFMVSKQFSQRLVSPFFKFSTFCVESEVSQLGHLYSDNCETTAGGVSGCDVELNGLGGVICTDRGGFVKGEGAM